MPLFGDDRGQKASYTGNGPLLAGETITGGRFRCSDCGHELEKPPGHVSNLPVCPSCQHDRWDRA
jgi:rubrerythrin